MKAILMIVNRLELDDFRNYPHLEVDFSINSNILFGNNAQGKTNILEAIFLAGTTKSHRGSKDKEMIRLSKEEAHVRVYILKDQISHKIDLHLREGKRKTIAIDGVPIKKYSDLFSMISVVSFSPEDLAIIKRGPAERRNFIDMELSQLDKIYLFHLINYTKAMTQKNVLLRQMSTDGGQEEMVAIWNEQLITNGSKLITLRERFIDEMNEIISPIHSKLTDGKEKLTLQYEPNVTANEIRSAIQNTVKKDISVKMSTIGPHRDDICFYIETEGHEKEDCRRFGSQGQQRTCALSLKLAEIELVNNKTKDTPIILLDDVLSELDRNRQTQLLESIRKMQTIVTCTGLEEFINRQNPECRVFMVENGTVNRSLQQ